MIVGVLSASAVPSFLNNRRVELLFNTTNDTLRLINDARNRAITGWSLGEDGGDDNTYIDREETFLPYRFGVWFNYDRSRSQILEFADANDDQRLNLADVSSDFIFQEEDSDVKINGKSIYSMPDPIFLSEIVGKNKDGDIKSYNQAYVFYEVPDGKMSLRGSLSGDENPPEVAWEELSWLRLEITIWELTEDELHDDYDDQSRKIVIQTVSDYAYQCALISEYNDDNEACNFSF